MNVSDSVSVCMGFYGANGDVAGIGVTKRILIWVANLWEIDQVCSICINDFLASCRYRGPRRRVRFDGYQTGTHDKYGFGYHLNYHPLHERSGAEQLCCWSASRRRSMGCRTWRSRYSSALSPV